MFVLYKIDIKKSRQLMSQLIINVYEDFEKLIVLNRIS